MAGNIVYLDDTNFQDTVSKGVTLVDFFADWCGPCRMIAPIIDELSTEMAGKATIAKLDIEKAQATTSSLGVTSIPTIIIFKNGKEVNRIVGIKDKETLKNLVVSSL
jgi:thioredoxin 1